MTTRPLVDDELLPLLDAFPSFDFSLERLPEIRAQFKAMAESAPPVHRPGVTVSERYIPGPADAPEVRVLIYTPPEGASAILYRETSHAPELAASQRVRSLDLLADGIVDRIVAEHPDAADEPEAFISRLSATIAHELQRLALEPDEARQAARFERYRRIGLV